MRQNHNRINTLSVKLIQTSWCLYSFTGAFYRVLLTQFAQIQIQPKMIKRWRLMCGWMASFWGNLKGIYNHVTPKPPSLRRVPWFVPSITMSTAGWRHKSGNKGHRNNEQHWCILYSSLWLWVDCNCGFCCFGKALLQASYVLAHDYSKQSNTKCKRTKY